MFSWPIDDQCELRLLDQHHAQEWLDLVSSDRDHIRQWLPWVNDFKTLEDAKTFIQATQSTFAAGTGMRGGIWMDGKLIGGASYQEIVWSNNIISVGCWISKPCQGRGIATRCLSSLIDHAFRELKINRVEARCIIANQRSRALAERVGMKLEGIFRQSLWMNGGFVDEAMYSLLAYEWQATNQQK